MTPVALFIAVMTVFAVGAGAAIATRAAGNAKARRTLRDVPRVAIGKFRHGRVGRIVGRLSLEEGTGIVAPFSGRQCAMYVATVEAQASAEHDTWTTILREVVSRPFILTEETGRAFVDPTGAEFVLDVDAHTTSGDLEAPTERQRAFLDRHGEDSKGLFFERRLRYREGVLEQGERVTVLGRGYCSYDDTAPAPTLGGAYRRPAAGRRVDLRSTDDQPLYLSDDPTLL